MKLNGNMSGITWQPSFFGTNLPSVKPKIKVPKGELFYLDFTYNDILYQRRIKIEKLYEKIKKKNV